jgi:hypothetical protein
MGRLAAAAAAGVALWCCTRGGPPAPSAEELARLEQVRDGLRRRLAELRAADPLLSEAPAADVLIGLPAAFATDLVEQVTAGFLQEVELVIEDVEVSKEGEVSARVLFGTVHPGRYALDVTLDRAVGRLRPGPPVVEFRDGRVHVSLPVALAGGEARGTVRLRWESQGVASAICEDFEATTPVAGSVQPRSYRVQGAFELANEGGRLTARPRFKDLVVNLEVQPSQATWDAVGRLIEDRSLRCRTALKVVDVPSVLRGFLAKGFRVRVPSAVFPSIQFPGGLEQELSFEGRTYELALRPTELKVLPDLLWYGAELSAEADAAEGFVQ